MRIPWKYLGLAGVAGVAATGVVVARRRRAHREDIEPDELRARLRERLAESERSTSVTPDRSAGGPAPRGGP